mgnify:CR=1 FL=1
MLSVSLSLEIPYNELWDINTVASNYTDCYCGDWVRGSGRVTRSVRACSHLDPSCLFVTQISSPVFHPVYVALVCLCSSLTCYYLTLHALKSKLNVFSYALPIALTTPVCMAMILTFGYASESFTGDVLKQYVSRNNLFVIISGSKVFIAGCGKISDAFIGDLYLHYDLALFHFSFITRSQQMGTSTIKITGICLLVRCCRVISTFH